MVALALASTEDVIAQKDSSAPTYDEEDTVSPDGRWAAWRTPRGNKWAVMLNGQRQAGEYDEVCSLTFSPSGGHLAFMARTGKTWVPVLDGKEAAQRYEKVGRPVFSHDGQRLMFAAKRDGKWTVVADGQEIGGQYDAVEFAMFSPDGQRHAIVARRGGEWLVVLDGKPGQSFDIIGGGTFSSDGRRFTYAAADVRKGLGGNKARGRVVVDFEAGPQFEGNAVGSWTQNMAAGRRLEIARGYEGRPDATIHGVGAPTCSPDGSRIAYAAHRGKDDAVVMLDGQPGPKFTSIADGPVFSGDSRHVAYVASDAGGAILVVDGERVASSVAFERVGNKIYTGGGAFSQTKFAPDNKRVSYVRLTNVRVESETDVRATRQLYLDGAAVAEYDALGLWGPWFTPDGRHMAYVVHGVKDGARNVAFVVADGAEGMHYDAVFPGTMALLDSGTIEYAARADRKFLRVTQPVR
jgi:hypothetical protein